MKNAASARTLGRRAAALWRRRRGSVSLVPGVRGSDHNLEVITILAGVGSGGGFKPAAPERALVVCDGPGVGAVGGGV